MSEYHDEKTSLLNKASSIHIRQVSPKDARAIAALDKYSIEHSLGATGDSSSSFEEIEKSIKAIEMVHAPSLIYLVVEKAGPTGSITSTVVNLTRGQRDHEVSPGGLLGYIVVAPYTGGHRQPRSCFKQTASVYITLLGDELIGRELGRSVRQTLVAEAIVRARENSYKSIIFDVASGEDPALKEAVNNYTDMGFEQAGLLRGIMEKNNLLLDRVLLQKTI